jgi:hypothetical protein
MSAASAPEVHVDVLPPLPRDGTPPPPLPQSFLPPFADLGTFYHPASGVVILGLDWLAFGTDIMTGLLALPVICVLSFLVSFPVLFAIQRKWSKESVPSAIGKAFLGAFMVGLPFPITGTMLGAAILVLSGLPHHPVEAVRRLAARSVAK